MLLTKARQAQSSRYAVRLGKGRKPGRRARVQASHPIILAIQRNRVKLAGAFQTWISTVQRQIPIGELSRLLLEKDWPGVLRLVNVGQRLRDVAEGKGLPHGTLSFRDALRTAFFDGANIGVERLSRVKVSKAKVSTEMSFDMLNPEAIQFITNYEFNLIKGISDQATESIRQIVLDAFNEGGHPTEQARLIRDVIGLTPQQVQAVNNFRGALENQRYGDALNRELRDRRHDGTLESAQITGEELDPDLIDSMTDKYFNRYLNYRANTIARTETSRASNAGQRMAWNQAKDQGLLDNDNTVKIWILGPDPCNDCQDVADANQDGVGLDESYEEDGGDGPPLHPNCVCTEGIRLLSGPMSDQPQDEE